MANSPHMPANMPIAQQRVVRGEAIRRLPGSVTGGGGGGSGNPAWDWPGLVNALGVFTAIPSDVATTYTSVAIVMTQVDADIEFDITVNGSVVESIVCADVQFQTFTISVPVVVDDLLNIDMTDTDTGAAIGLYIVLRP